MNKQDRIEFNPAAFEAKWQSVWESDKVFAPNLETAQKPYMNLMMFPYPSAEGLHVGNMYAQTGADVYGRFKRMQGYDVFVPMGLDGFGIHSENYALKVGVHPIRQAKITQERFYKQMKAIGTSVDWSRTLETYDPVYYRWTQWLFIQLFKAGLAYRKKAEVNWCPSCKTVLSDEQVIDGKCERCNSTVEKRELEQWFFRITNYAERLLANIEGLDWTEKVKIAQKNWIGKKTGAVIEFKILPIHTNTTNTTNISISVFTTRPDTLYGATFLVVAPEHPFTQGIENTEVRDYIKLAKSKSNQDRTDEGKEKTGVFSGMYAINPVNGENIPIWIADYVLTGYGTGAIMAVPAHDTRDYDFAKKYALPIVEVVESSHPLPYVGEGVLINSGDWNGWEMPEQMEKVIKILEEKKIGEKQDNYHLRDWLISRQRYWGPPIPMIFCESCSITGKGEQAGMPGWYSVPETDLPVLLPDVEDWKPMGTPSTGSGQGVKSPLANHPEFYETTCPGCGGKAKRETDVSDTFLDSAWYFLGYITSSITERGKNPESISRGIEVDQKTGAPWDKNVQKKWLPVKKYIGGAEHSVLHLLYARFISMVLADLKFTDFEEPFESFFAHGLIIKDGAKMSKSKGNVVVPDTYIEKYGADTLRTYLMFLGPFSDGGDFRDSGIEGMNRFLKRVWTLIQKSIFNFPLQNARGKQFSISNELSNEANFQMHKAIKRVTEDIEAFKYNTAISAIMEYYHFLSKQDELSKLETETFLKLLAPFAPYMTEELWQGSQFTVHSSQFRSIHLEKWPEWDEKYLVSSEVTIVVQVNGKKRADFNLDTLKLKDEEKVKAEAKVLVEKYLEGREPKKTIYVQGKIVNFVV